MFFFLGLRASQRWLTVLYVLSRSVVSDSLQPHGLQPARLLCPFGFSWQGYWSGLPCPPPGDLRNPRIQPRSSAFQANSLPTEPLGMPFDVSWAACLLPGVWTLEGVPVGTWFCFHSVNVCKALRLGLLKVDVGIDGRIDKWICQDSDLQGAV